MQFQNGSELNRHILLRINHYVAEIVVSRSKKASTGCSNGPNVRGATVMAGVGGESTNLKVGLIIP